MQSRVRHYARPVKDRETLLKTKYHYLTKPMKTTKEMVEACLRNIPETRNSDITLMIEVWRRYFPQRIKRGQTGEEGIWLKDLYDLPREDNIKRERAKFNAVVS